MDIALIDFGRDEPDAVVLSLTSSAGGWCRSAAALFRTIQVCDRDPSSIAAEVRQSGRCREPAHEVAGIHHPACILLGSPPVARSAGAAADGAGCRIPRTQKARQDSPTSWLRFTEPSGPTAIAKAAM